MTVYSLPDFVNGLERNLFFIRLLESHPGYFADGVRIGSVYGCFPSCVLNGGRTFVRERYTATQMERTFALLNAQGVTARLTLTNMLVEKEHLRDPYFLEMMDCAREHKVEVIIHSELLSDFIARRYGFSQILSTTHLIDDVDELNRATERYDSVVLNYNHNKDRTFIESISRPEKVEVMVNEFCRPRCLYRQAHYAHNSKDQLDGMIRPFEPARFCGASMTHPHSAHASDHPVILTTAQVRELSDTYGIGHFKIVGRGVAFETVLEAYAYYLLKPEHRDSLKRLAHLALR